MPVSNFTIQVTAYFNGDENESKQKIVDLLKDTSASSIGKDNYYIEVRNAKVV